LPEGRKLTRVENAKVSRCNVDVEIRNSEYIIMLSLLGEQSRETDFKGSNESGESKTEVAGSRSVYSREDRL
jgi:hypothetical protein